MLLERRLAAPPPLLSCLWARTACMAPRRAAVTGPQYRSGRGSGLVSDWATGWVRLHESIRELAPAVPAPLLHVVRMLPECKRVLGMCYM